MLTIAADPKHLGARTGIASVLHRTADQPKQNCAADQRTALPDQCLHSAEADVQPPRQTGIEDKSLIYPGVEGGVECRAMADSWSSKSHF